MNQVICWDCKVFLFSSVLHYFWSEGSLYKSAHHDSIQKIDTTD